MVDVPYLDLLAKSITRCTKCPLHANRLRAVPGSGNAESGAVLVLEKPDKAEDLIGKPVQGTVGARLDKVLAAVGLGRRDFFTTHVIKCKPAWGHPLTMAELNACHPYLTGQLEALDPRIVVLAGNYAVSDWFPGERIGSIHGQPRSVWKPWTDTDSRPLIVIPVYHPASTLRADGVPIESCIEDFAVVAALIHDLKQHEQLEQVA